MHPINKTILCVIPARMASSRFYGKPLRPICGQPMIRWVYEQTKKTGYDTIIATDDAKICDAVHNFGGNAVMTEQTHESGTARCEEATAQYETLTGKRPNVVINIQGDEPLIDPKQIVLLAESFDSGVHQITTLVHPEWCSHEKTLTENNAYAVVSTDCRALYFSRFVIPYNKSKLPTLKYRHIGIYAYGRDCLRQFVALSPSSLEQCESLEQNRWLDANGTIHVFETHDDGLSVDTPKDLKILENFLLEHPEKNIFLN